MTTTELIPVMIDRIVRDFHPVRILLFGSHARGEAGPESDVDLLVVLPEVADKRQAAVEIRRALREFPVCKDIIVTTLEEIARRGDLVGTVLRPALREGKVLYERGISRTMNDEWEEHRRKTNPRVTVHHSSFRVHNSYMGEARYPGDWPEATESDARAAVQQARAVWTSVCADFARHGLQVEDAS